MRITGQWNTRHVQVDGKLISSAKSFSVHPHSPDGFAWGYGGSGPAQLALALMLLVTDAGTAKRLYQDFKREYIVELPQADFELEVDLAAYVRHHG